MRKSERMRHVIVLCALLLTSTLAAKSVANPVHAVDSLLAAYSSASRSNKADIGDRLIKLCMADDNLLSIQRKTTSLHSDTLDFFVWLAAERFYYNNSYFKESIGFIDKALPLATANAPEYHATLLCDRGYCLFKTGHNTEATEAELKAERFSKKHGLLLPQARAYNYLAIINLSLGSIDEAKHFVQKAIDTDRLTGSDQNTHNYLGIACEVFSVAKEPDMAISYGRRAVEAARAIGYTAGVVNHLSQLSYAYNRKGDLQQALAMSQEAVKTVEQMDVVDRNLLAISLEYVAFNLLDMKRNSEAVPVIRRAIGLQEELGNYRSVCYDYLSLAEALETDQPHESNKALHRYAKMLDSLHHAEMHEALSNANAALHNDELQEANEESRRNFNRIAIAALAGILLLSAVIAVLAYINHLRRRTQEATERLQKARETFFTNVTHELRTPLTVILGLTRLLNKKEKDADKKESLAMIERNGQSLLTLVNQLLDISKMTSETMQFSWQQGDVAAFVEMIVEHFRPMADLKGVDLSFNAASQAIPTFFVADAMQKMVGNLISNAIKFTPKGGEVAVGIGTNGKELQVSVEDNGVGIQPEDIERLFEPFFQGTNHERTGTGVGLALVSQLAKALGGKVGVSSTPGEKTRFFIALPLKETLSEGDRLVAATALHDIQTDSTETMVKDGRKLETAAEDESEEGGKTRILVVEDNADVAAFIGSVLAERYAVAYAYDGAEGERKAAEWMPDLVVTDIMMPEVDGLEMCRRIRSSEQTNHIPIIIITARNTDSDRLSGIEAGAEAYLCKPFMAEELLLRIDKILEQRRMLQQKFQKTVSAPEADTAVSNTAATIEPSKEETIYERNLSESNQAFLHKVDEVIFRLMPEGKVDVQEVATAVCLSRSQFGRKLRAVVDMSPSDYINDVRLNEVRRLLHSQPQLSLLDIALRTGFSDHAHLTHAFTRKFGVSPSLYIRQANAAN